MEEESIDETIHVAERVYKAGEALDGAVEGDGFNVAAVIRDYYRRARKKKKAAFWKEVYDYLMTKECVGKGALTVGVSRPRETGGSRLKKKVGTWIYWIWRTITNGKERHQDWHDAFPLFLESVGWAKIRFHKDGQEIRDGKAILVELERMIQEDKTDKSLRWKVLKAIRNHISVADLLLETS